MSCICIGRGFPADIIFTGMKQKQRMEEAGNHIEIDPPTNEELASTTSAPNLSPTNKHQQEIHSFYDMANSFSLPEVSPTNGQQQEMHSYFDIAIATPESTSNISPIDGQQQEMHHFCDIDIPISSLDLSPTNSPLPEVTSFWNAVSPEMVSLSDNFTMPLHQMSAHSPPLCSHALTPGTELYLHRHQQQQQQSAPNMWNNRTSMNYSPEFLAHEFSHPGCICPTSPEPTSCCSGSGGVGLQQQQQMRIVHHSIPPSYWPWSRSKTCLHSSYGRFDNSCGSPHGMLPSPAPSKRGHCCHHNEYFPIMDHATPMYKDWH
jgi:hypothetical protein